VLDKYPQRLSIQNYLKEADSIPGWFAPIDVLLFQKFDQFQYEEDLKGDLLEIGVYQGRSAILLGYFRREQEQLVVCDVFETPAATDANRVENQTSYQGLSRRIFEENYHRFHDHLPLILTCDSTNLSSHKLSRRFRFIHIDGSHLYEAVRADIENAKRILIDGGIVVFDDFRRAPGIAAAVWQEVVTGGLIPFCFTEAKMYGAWNTSPSDRLAALRAWAGDHASLETHTEVIFGHPVLGIKMKRAKANTVAPNGFRNLAKLLVPPGVVILGRWLRDRICIR